MDPAPVSTDNPPLPVIDLSDPDTIATAARLRRACTEQGFFYLIGHGVDPALMEAAVLQCRALFALPLADKLALRPTDGDGCFDASQGYSPYQSETLNPQEQKQPCTQEGFRLKLTTGRGAEADAAARAAHPWPEEAAVPGFRATLLEYHEAMQALAYRVTQLLLEAVGLSPVRCTRVCALKERTAVFVDLDGLDRSRSKSQSYQPRVNPHARPSHRLNFAVRPNPHAHQSHPKTPGRSPRRFPPLRRHHAAAALPAGALRPRSRHHGLREPHGLGLPDAPPLGAYVYDSLLFGLARAV